MSTVKNSSRMVLAVPPESGMRVVAENLRRRISDVQFINVVDDAAGSCAAVHETEKVGIRA